MKFGATEMQGAVLIELERHEDERGFFMRTFDAEEFAGQGLETRFPQVSQSHNRLKGTLRGMHFQRAPHGETKLVRCVRGAVHDVIVDLRPGSPSYGRWQGFVLSAENARMLYIPEGFAHGFQTLVDDTDVIYHISAAFAPEAAAGVAHDDPAFAIAWPLPVSVISAKDAAWPRVDLARGVPI
jgi:dTDP-4-dehydrorhamnose 3,5-epimerase